MENVDLGNYDDTVIFVNGTNNSKHIFSYVQYIVESFAYKSRLVNSATSFIKLFFSCQEEYGRTSINIKLQLQLQREREGVLVRYVHELRSLY